MTRLWLLTKCLTFDKIPTVFNSFKQSSLIWLFQVKLESNVMPRYLVESTFLINHYVSHQVRTETADQNRACHVRDWSFIMSWGGGGRGFEGGGQFSKRLDSGGSILKMYEMWGGRNFKT